MIYISAITASIFITTFLFYFYVIPWYQTAEAKRKEMEVLENNKKFQEDIDRKAEEIMVLRAKKDDLLNEIEVLSKLDNEKPISDDGKLFQQIRLKKLEVERIDRQITRIHFIRPVNLK